MSCKVMGIVNVTPDSFSDGGQFFKPEEAIRRAKNLVADGADIIDLGGESTRPGATPIGWEEEWARIEPVLAVLRSIEQSNNPNNRTILSVDTYHPETAERAIRAGADIINCVYPEPVAEMIRVIADAAQDTELVVPYRIGDEDFRRETEDARYQSGDPMGSGIASRTNCEKRRDVVVFAAGCRTIVIARFARVIAT